MRLRRKPTPPPVAGSNGSTGSGNVAVDIDLAAVVDWGTFHGVFREFKVRCPEQYDSLIDCTAFVNWRRVEAGNDPVLVLAFCT